VTEPNTPEPRLSGDLPPDLPPEYADAYLRGYQRAWATSHGDPEPVAELVAGSVAEREPMTSYDDLFADVEPTEWEGPTHREPLDHPEKPGWFVPAVLGGLVLLLILGAYGLGRVFSSSVGSDSPSGDERLEVPPISSPASTKPAGGKAWDGDVTPLSGVSAASSCVLPPGTDAAGRKVSYTPDRAVDGDFTTAWRCSGNGHGVTLRLDLDGRVRLAEVGLVPGYAKTDPKSNADRYAENNRITKVRWTFADGRSVTQQLDGSPGNRDLQTMRIPPVETDSVTMEILESVKGSRNTVAVSEVQLAETVG
jgi:hypothetical protein